MAVLLTRKISNRSLEALSVERDKMFWDRELTGFGVRVYPTVANLAERIPKEHNAVRCNPKTQRTARGVVNHHIVPALARLPLVAIERKHVTALHESICEVLSMANMAVENLSPHVQASPG